MSFIVNHYNNSGKILPKTIRIFLTFMMLALTVPTVFGAPKNTKGSGSSDNQFVVVLDAGHGGKDIGATDNGVQEKNINLAVALKVGEMLKKKMKDTKVVFTRDDDTFVTLQGRADIANKNKADLFVSIHTNSVDKSNKNRANIAGASVYALGLHKDDNNMNVARRENSVIEMEGNFEQKYSGFDPSKDESYIIFEMAQKKNLAQSIKFANEVQRNMVDIAGRKDRGVHQAGFWVLWATSMPSVLIELDFICNPQSAKFMDSKDGVEKMAEAIFKAIKSYEEKYVSRKGLTASSSRPVRSDRSIDEIMSDSRQSGLISDDVASSEQSSSVSRRDRKTANHSSSTVSDSRRSSSRVVGSRRRRSQQAAASSAAHNYQTGEIALLTESEWEQPVVEVAATDTKKVSADDSKDSKGKKKKKEKKNKKKDSKKQAKTLSGSKHRMTTVYTIQILASEDQLSGSNPRFHGLSPIYAFRENNMYKYTYGEAKTREDIEPLLKKVREKIPDAFIIAKTRSM